MYTWRHYRNFHPYAKLLVDYGAQKNIQIDGFPSWYKSDKWMIYAPGGGVEAHAWRNVWVRADYEYQFWKVEWFDNNFLNPQGATLGVSYDFSRIRPH
jgi:opacity protein-like surface antigen